MPGRFLEPDHGMGDANTIGGYARVHGRPAAFEGSDGLSYSAAIEVEATGEPDRPYGACLVFLQWRRVGPPGVEAHLETPYLAWGPSEERAREALGAWLLADVKRQLDEQILRAASSSPSRRWWDAMRDESE